MDATEHELIVEERISVRVGSLNGLATLVVKNVEPEIEPAEQFNEPLVNERFRHKDQHTLYASRLDQPMNNQAGFDRLAQAHLIGEQHARDKTASHLSSDVKLVRDEIDTTAHKSAHF